VEAGREKAAVLCQWGPDPVAALRRLAEAGPRAEPDPVAAARYLQAELDRAAALWWRQVAAPLAAALDRAGRQLAESLRPLGAALDRLGELDLEQEADPALADPAGLAAAGLLGPLAPRPPAGW